MNKIDTEELGIVATEYYREEPYAKEFQPAKAIEQLAEKINEIIDYINKHETKE